MKKATTYPVVEIFESVQGEGYNTGKKVVFLRFGGCNLDCAWCDTDWRRFETLDEQMIMDRVAALEAKALIVTGGEPLVQRGLSSLLARFKKAGYWIGIETNGLVAPSAACRRRIDYLAVSPKACFAARYREGRMIREADEVRIVVEGDVRVFCEAMRRRIKAAHYFLSPCERNGRMNMEETIRLLGVLNQKRTRGKWLLSLQTHKLAGLR